VVISKGIVNRVRFEREELVKERLGTLCIVNQQSSPAEENEGD
jgi:hypothetical protein